MTKFSLHRLKDYFYNRDKAVSSDEFADWYLKNETEEDFNHLLQDIWQESGSARSDRQQTATAFNRVRKSIYGSYEPRKRNGLVRCVRFITKVAAILALPLLCTTFYLLHNGARESQVNWIEVCAANGERKELTLPDSSKIWLNSGTRVLYPEKFVGTRRIFVSGETFLDVKKDPEHPFVVDTRHVSIRVYGTSFNVRSYNEDMQVETALLKGSISLQIKRNEATKEIFIVPGEKVSVSNQDKTINRERFDVDDYLSWREGKYTFKDKTLAEIALELERIFNVQIVIRDRSLLKENYFVTFAQGLSLDEMLEALNINNGLQIKRDGNIIEILEKKIKTHY